MFTRKPRLQLEKFAINGAKRLLQHNRPIAASDVCDRVSGVGESGHRIPGHPCQTECDANIRPSAEILLCSIAVRRPAEMEAGRIGPET